MALAPVVDALHTLRAAFRRAEITGADDQITVELPLEAGRKFETWVVANATPANCAALLSTFRTDDHPTHPYRHIDVGPVRVRWPLERRAEPDGSVYARAVATGATNVRRFSPRLVT